jgi:hypothetical protein
MINNILITLAIIHSIFVPAMILVYLVIWIIAMMITAVFNLLFCRRIDVYHHYHKD